jgi:hypothetical protein
MFVSVAVIRECCDAVILSALSRGLCRICSFVTHAASMVV